MEKITLLAKLVCGMSLLLSTSSSHADALNDWNTRTSEIGLAAKLSTPQACRTGALVQTAVYEAVNAITRQYGGRTRSRPREGASVDAAIAAASRAVLLQLLPAQQAAIDDAYQAGLAAIADGTPKREGIDVGEAAAAAVLSARANDGGDAVEHYRPYTTAGVYVPTALPIVPHWPERKPWAMTSANQFRPGAPPALSSRRWAADFNESRDFGARTSTYRDAEQTAVAKFWETTNPMIYFQVVRSVTDSTGRDVTRNARLLAVAAQAMDDALIAVFDAKHAYNFWRPITAIRNAGIDGNEATAADASWLPLIETPMHPEYPCAHCTVSAAVAAVLEAEIGPQLSSPLHAISPTLPGVERRWSDFAAFTAEVANARVWAGVHYRNSAAVGTSLGRKVGANVAAHAFR